MRQLWSLLALLSVLVLTAPGLAHAAPCGSATLPSCEDLSVGLTPPAGNVYVGELVAVTVTTSNAGPYFFDRVSTSIAVPGTVSLLGSTHVDGECVARCSVPISPTSLHGSRQDVIRIRPEVAGPMSVTATVALPAGSRRVDPNLANNTATITLNPVVGRCTSEIVSPELEFADSVMGSIGGDVMTGSELNDELYGLAGDDCLEGSQGDDIVSGGEGSDLLKGGPGDDRIIGGPGHDRIQGNDGADLINTVDGYRDSVSCGAGKDRLRADQFDHFHGCEHVTIVRHARVG